MVGMLDQAPRGAQSFQRAAVNPLAVVEVREPHGPASHAAFIALMQQAQNGGPTANLSLVPVHQRVLARLLALHSTMRGLSTGLSRQYTRTVTAFVHDVETRGFLLDLGRTLGAAEAGKGLKALLMQLEGQLADIVKDPGFAHLYLEDRYHILLSELRYTAPGTGR